MRAISIHETGPPSVLQLRDIDRPEPAPGEALVRVYAAGVNFADVVMRRGMIPSPLPMVPGVEGAGIVEAVGRDVTDVAKGDRVAWAPVMGAGAIVGSYAEYECVAADALLPVPDAVSLETAAAVTLQGLTAHYLLNDKKKIEPGTQVLVTQPPAEWGYSCVAGSADSARASSGRFPPPRKRPWRKPPAPMRSSCTRRRISSRGFSS